MVADARRVDKTPLLIGVLFAIATILFVWGAFAERSGHHDETKSHATPSGEQAGNGESAEQRANEAGGATAANETGGEAEYRPLGIDLESTPLVLAAAAVSLLFAALVAFRPSPATLFAVVILGAGFTALELVEVVHQADQNRIGLLILALAAGILHAVAALLAARALWAERQRTNAIPAV
jgi:hypothetical protein